MHFLRVLIEKILELINQGIGDIILEKDYNLIKGF